MILHQFLLILLKIPKEQNVTSLEFAIISWVLALQICIH